MHSLPAWFSPPEDIEKKANTHRDYPFFAADDNDVSIGFVALKIHNPYTADIFNLGVLEHYHRQGIGTALMDIAVQRVREEKRRAIMLETQSRNENALAFYLAYGFTLIGFTRS